MLRNAFTALLFCSILFVSSTGLVAAATAKTPAKAATPSATTNTNTLKVSPVRTELSIAPGTSGTVKTYITNLTKTAITVSPIENDFVAGDENGTPSIVLDENSYAPTHSLKRFMVPLQNVTVGAGETREVDVTVTVPKSARAGGYYGAIRYAPANADGSKSVNLSTSVASLILMTVPGPTTEDLRMTNFDIQQNGSNGSNFRTPDNMNLLLRFQNKGNVQEAPLGQINVQKNKKVLYTYNFNQVDPKDNVLPDSARRWNIPLKGFGKFGKYTVTGTFSYANGKSIEATKTIWIVPTTYIIIGASSIIGLIFLVILIVIGLKTYKRKILRSSSRHRRR